MPLAEPLLKNTVVGNLPVDVVLTLIVQPYTFGAIINRDECFKLLVVHGIRHQLPWATPHAAGNSRSQSPAPDFPSSHDNSPPPSAKAERSFRMSDLRDDLDDDDKFLLMPPT